MERLTVVSHRIAETLNRAVDPQAPYVGSSAFAHKAGLHVSAIARAKDAYEHVSPEAVGNGTRFVVSEMAGKATIQMKADDLGLDIDGPAVMQVIDDLKRLEHEGYHFEAADASLELLMRRSAGWEHDFFRVESMRVITDEVASGDFNTEATVKVWVGDERYVFTAEGNGPVNAIDTALRRAVSTAYPQLDHIHLTDYKVRILDGAGATGAVTRVLLSATDGERDWTTIGVSPNIIEASWRALEESRRLRAVARPRHLPDDDDVAYDGLGMAAPRSAPSGERAIEVLLVARRGTRRLESRTSGHRRGAAAGRAAAWALKDPTRGSRSTIADRLAPRLRLQGRERLDDAIRGCLGIALRRASLFSRAPVVHDLTIAFTIWGFFDEQPPDDLIARRPQLFEGVGNVNHHYAEGRVIADLVPESTLRMTPEQVAAGYPERWRELTGA